MEKVNKNMYHIFSIKSENKEVFGCNNDRLLTEKYKVKDHISNSKQDKGDHYYIQTRHKDLFSH